MNSEDMGRKIAELEESKSNVHTKLKDMEKTIEILKEQIELEKVKYSELEVILAKERNTQHEQHLNIQNIEKDKNQLKNENHRLSLRIQSNF
jgi:hypothetical protein